MRRAFTILPLLVVAAGAPLAAQVFQTGTGGVIGTQDLNWTVTCTAGPAAGADCGASENPFIVNSVNGVWQPDAATGTNWISYWNGSSSADGVGNYGVSDDANHRYTYEFTASFDGGISGGTLDFFAGWDNKLAGISIDGGAFVLPSTLAVNPALNTDGLFGFCRDGDGVFPSSNNTGNASTSVCDAEFNASVGGGTHTITFEVYGDGETDGLWANGDIASSTQSVTPEPGTMALMATGLVGMAGASFRRRRRNK